MRIEFIPLAVGLTLCSAGGAAFGECDDKSQQNAADEAAVRGDLSAGSKCAQPADKERSEKKNEEAVGRAKRDTSSTGGQDQRQENQSTR